MAIGEHSIKQLLLTIHILLFPLTLIWGAYLKYLSMQHMMASITSMLPV
nr:MAG TPA: hypothetical protein [Caudoviricetes sp.]